jgi:hypothetical protein
MAGFKQPVYEILSFNLNHFQFTIGTTNYLNKYHSPIADDATYDYNYKLLDTVAIDGRLSYMIYFKNKKRSKAAGLEGILYIDQTIMLLQKLLCVSKVFFILAERMILNMCQIKTLVSKA